MIRLGPQIRTTFHETEYVPARDTWKCPFDRADTFEVDEVVRLNPVRMVS